MYIATFYVSFFFLPCCRDITEKPSPDSNPYCQTFQNLNSITYKTPLVKITEVLWDGYGSNDSLTDFVQQLGKKAYENTASSLWVV